MDFGKNYKSVGIVDIASIKEKVSMISEEQWNADDHRQRKFKIHEYTQTISLIYDSDFRSSNPTILPYYHELCELLEPIMYHVSNHYDTSKEILDLGIAPGFFIRMVLVRLLPHSSIPEHLDAHASLMFSHRVHIPIITTEDTVFTINGETKQMLAGECWEINNQRIHSVDNNSDDIRVHLIMDYIIL